MAYTPNFLILKDEVEHKKINIFQVNNNIKTWFNFFLFLENGECFKHFEQFEFEYFKKLIVSFWKLWSLAIALLLEHSNVRIQSPLDNYIKWQMFKIKFANSSFQNILYKRSLICAFIFQFSFHGYFGSSSLQPAKPL